MKIEDGAKLYLDGKRALNSKNSNISGKGVFHIKGDMIHEGDNGVNLTLENGSFIESSSIQFDESNVGSSLRFKSGKITVNAANPTASNQRNILSTRLK